METSYNQVAGLYRTWWDVVETSFRLLLPPPQGVGMPAPGVQAGEAAIKDGAQDAVKPALDALNLMRRLLTQYSGAAFPLLASTQGVQDWQAWAMQNAERFKTFMETGAHGQNPTVESAVRGFTELAQAWTKPAVASAGGPPYFDALDRTFSALTDAIGMGPSKALRDAGRELLAADAQRRAAQLAYGAVLEDAWRKVIQGIAERLKEMEARGERVDSFLGLVRLAASVADRTMHEAMQSEAGLNAGAEYAGAAARFRLQLNRVVAIASGMLNVPTRAELDDAYFEIQQLKRQMRELKRGLKESQHPSRSADGAT